MKYWKGSMVKLSARVDERCWGKISPALPAIEVLQLGFIKGSNYGDN